MTDAAGSLLAVSDLHIGSAANRAVLESLRPRSQRDWLIVAGDVAERSADVVAALGLLAGRFARVIWVPGNHELWTVPRDPDTTRGDERYRGLVAACRSLGVVTPEDAYPVWDGPGGPVTVAPLFLLYDYSFLPAGVASKDEALASAYESGIVCTDELLLHPDPYVSRDAWCGRRRPSIDSTSTSPPAVRPSPRARDRPGPGHRLVRRHPVRRGGPSGRRCSRRRPARPRSPAR